MASVIGSAALRVCVETPWPRLIEIPVRSIHRAIWRPKVSFPVNIVEGNSYTASLLSEVGAPPRAPDEAGIRVSGLVAGIAYTEAFRLIWSGVYDLTDASANDAEVLEIVIWSAVWASREHVYKWAAIPGVQAPEVAPAGAGAVFGTACRGCLRYSGCQDGAKRQENCTHQCA